MTPARPIFEYEIGQRYPGAMPGDGMLLHLHETDGDDGIEALFIVGLFVLALFIELFHS